MDVSAFDHLRRLCRQHPELLELPRRCKAALADTCHSLATERLVIGLLHDAGVPAQLLELRTSRSLLPLEQRIAQVASDAAAWTALGDAWIMWGVFGWAQALGLKVDISKGLSPVIVSFSARVDEGWVVLNWEVLGEGVTLHLDPIGPVTGQKHHRDRPREPRVTYTLRATNTAGERFESVTVTLPEVQIRRFSLEPAVLAAGEQGRLVWEVANAASVAIDGVGNLEAASECLIDADSARAFYELRASGSDGQVVTERIEVKTVRILEFKATPTPRPDKPSFSLEWRTENAARIELVGYGDVDPNGRIQLKERRKDTQMTLRAYSPSGACVRQKILLKAVRIKKFTAEVPVALEGTSILFAWQVEGARHLFLTGAGDVTGLRQASVVIAKGLSVLKLTAIGDAGVSERICHIHVRSSPRLPRVPIAIYGAPPPDLERLAGVTLGPLSPLAQRNPVLLAAHRFRPSRTPFQQVAFRVKQLWPTLRQQAASVGRLQRTISQYLSRSRF